MARTNNLTNFLTDVAGAIKTKKGSQTAIQAANFDTEILALPSQGTYQEKTVTITQNGQTTLTPDTGYDATDQVEITVNVPIKQLQSKTVSVTSNGNVSLLPDTGYDGFNEVNLQVNVPTGGEINNQDKTITENGTYTADQGYTGLGTVNVNVQSADAPVKLFNSIAEMQADSSAQEGDKAIVYRKELKSITQDSEFSSCIFPNVVVLDEELDDDVDARFGSTSEDWFDGDVSISSSSFNFNGYGDSGQIRVEYESKDGITYTRTDGGEELQEFGTTIQWSDDGEEDFNSVIGNFMKISGNYFEGLFEYGESKTQLYNSIQNFIVDVTQKTITPTQTEVLLLPTLDIIAKRLYDLGSSDPDYVERLLVVKKNGIYYGYNIGSESLCFKGQSLLAGLNSQVRERKRYILNLDKASYSSDGTYLINIPITEDGSTHYYGEIEYDEIVALFVNKSSKPSSVSLCVVDDNNVGYRTNIQDFILFQTATGWHYADTQLSLITSGELYPNIVGYGNLGVSTGDGTIYNRLDYNKIFNFDNVYLTVYEKNVYGRLNNCLCSNKTYNKLLYLKRTQNGEYLCGPYRRHNYSGGIKSPTYNSGYRMYYDMGNRYYHNGIIYNLEGVQLKTLFTTGMVCAIVNDEIYYIDTTDGKFYHYNITTDIVTLINTIPLNNGYKAAYMGKFGDNIYMHILTANSSSQLQYNMYVYNLSDETLYTNPYTFYSSSTTVYYKAASIIYTNQGVYFHCHASNKVTTGNRLYHFNPTTKTFSDLGQLSGSASYGLRNTSFGYVDTNSNTLCAYSSSDNTGYMYIDLTNMTYTVFKSIKILEPNGNIISRGGGGDTIRYLDNGAAVYYNSGNNKLYVGSFTMVDNVLTFTSTDYMYMWYLNFENELSLVDTPLLQYNISLVNANQIIVLNELTGETHTLYRYNAVTNSADYDCVILNTADYQDRINGEYVANNIMFTCSEDDGGDS